MAQGWSINPVTDIITFLEPPALGVNNIVVNEYASGATGATDVWALSAWSERHGYPSEGEFFGGRLCAARSRSEPQTLWLSQSEDYTNFGKSTPIEDSDAITATLNARQVNAIQELVPLDKLIMMTTGGEWKTGGGQDDVLTPSTISFKPQSYYGASGLPALVVGNSALFAQNRGYIVRDIAYSFETDGYNGNDLTIFSSHLITGYSIVSWAFQTVPYSAAWMARNDGVLLSMTYQKDQQVIGWARHVTDGIVEDVCVVPEEGENAVYVIVRRTVGGVEKRFIERMRSRQFEHPRDWFFVDSGLSFDGRNTTATTMTLTGSGWTSEDELTLTASAAFFVGVSDVGDWIVFDYEASAEQSMLRLEIIEFISTTVVKVRALRNVPVEWQAVAVTDWAVARDTLSGLGHLEGRDVVVLSDALVQGARPVTAGTITLDNPGVVVHAGLPYIAEIETLDINVPGAETVRTRNKIIPTVSILVGDGRGVWAGPSADRLEQYETRDAEDYQAPPGVTDGLVTVYASKTWEDRGRIVVQQQDPLALSILAIIPEVEFGEK